MIYLICTARPLTIAPIILGMGAQADAVKPNIFALALDIDLDTAMFSWCQDCESMVCSQIILHDSESDGVLLGKLHDSIVLLRQTQAFHSVSFFLDEYLFDKSKWNEEQWSIVPQQLLEQRLQHLSWNRLPKGVLAVKRQMRCIQVHQPSVTLTLVLHKSILITIWMQTLHIMIDHGSVTHDLTHDSLIYDQ